MRILPTPRHTSYIASYSLALRGGHLNEMAKFSSFLLSLHRPNKYPRVDIGQLPSLHNYR